VAGEIPEQGEGRVEEKTPERVGHDEEYQQRHGGPADGKTGKGTEVGQGRKGRKGL